MRLKLVLFRLLALTALVGAGIHLLDSQSSVPILCGFESGCADVAASAYSRIGPVPLSLLGLVFFTSFFVATLFPSLFPALGPVALLAGVAGLALLAIQAFLLKAFCQTCLVVDAAAMLLAVVELAIPVPWQTIQLRRWPWLCALAFLFSALLLTHALRPTLPIPDEVIAKRQPGKVNLFLITDFECDHCRMLHDTLEGVLAEYGDRVALWMEPLPLPKNPNARAAARLFWLARRQEKGEEMASLLFRTDVLNQADLEKLAKQVGVSERFPPNGGNAENLDREIDAATAWLDRRGFRGLPILWIEDELFSGFVDEKTMKSSINRALRHHPR